jgi:hypothetical protein
MVDTNTECSTFIFRMETTRSRESPYVNNHKRETQTINHFQIMCKIPKFKVQEKLITYILNETPTSFLIYDPSILSLK